MAEIASANLILLVGAVLLLLGILSYLVAMRLGAPLLLVFLALGMLAGRAAARLGVASDANRYFEMFLVAALDATLAAQNAVLVAEAMGLGTVYIGAIRNRPEEVAAELKLPPLVFPVFGLCVGHPDPAQPAGVKPRLAQTAIVHREQYDAGAEADAVRSVSLSKAEIIRLGARLGVDFALTSSCYDPDLEGRACGACDSCAIRARGFGEAGVPDPTRYRGREGAR